MRHPLQALCLVVTVLLTFAPMSAQMVEESLAQDPGPLDFIRGDSYEQWILQSLAGDALVGLSAEGRLVPRLADRWEAQADGTVRFHLRSDARYPDGRRVRAEDVVWTVRQLLQQPQASPTKRAVLEGATVGSDGGQPWIRSPRPPGRLLMELARVPIAQAGHPEGGSGPFAFR